MQFSVGKEVWLRPTHYGKNRGYKNYVKGVVSRVGRKYVEVKYGDNWDEKAVFYLAEGHRQKSDYLPLWVLYEYEQDILNEIEMCSLRNNCKQQFTARFYNLTADQLRRILSVLEESEITTRLNRLLNRY